MSSAFDDRFVQFLLNLFDLIQIKADSKAECSPQTSGGGCGGALTRGSGQVLDRGPAHACAR